MDDDFDQFGISALYSFAIEKNAITNMQKVRGEIRALEDDFSQMIRAFEQGNFSAPIAKETATVKKSMQTVSTAAGQSADNMKLVRKAIAPLKQEFRALKAASSNITFGELNDDQQFKDASRAVKQYVRDLEALQQQIGGTTALEREFTEVLKRQQTIAQGRVDLAEAERRAARASQNLGSAQALQGAGKAILNTLSEPMEAAQELQQGLGTIAKLAGDISPQGLTDVKNEILGLSAAMATADTQVSSVFEDLAGAGKAFNDAIDPKTGRRAIQERMREVEQILKNKAALDITTGAATQLNITLGSIYKDSLPNYAGGVVEVNARAASSINELSDKLSDVRISAEDVIPVMNVVMNTIGDAANFPVDQIAAFSAAVSALGTIEPEAAGSFFNRFSAAISKNPAAFVEKLGYESAEAFDKALNEDKLDIIVRIAEQYKSINGELERGKFLGKGGLGIASAQDQKLIQGLSNNIKVLKEARVVAREGFYGEEGKELSVQAEFNRVIQTSAFQAERFNKTVTALKDTIGLAVQEAITPMLETLSNTMDFVLQLTQKFPGVTKAVSLGALAFGALAAAAGTAGVVLFSLEQAGAVATIALGSMERSMLPLTGFFQTAQTALSGTNPLETFFHNNTKLATDFGDAATLNFKETGRGLRALATQAISTGRAFVVLSRSIILSPLGIAIGSFILLNTLLEQVVPGFNLLGVVLGAIAAPFGFIYGLLKGLTESLLEFLGVTSGGTLGAIAPLFQTISNAIQVAAKSFMLFASSGERVGQALGHAIVFPFRFAGETIVNIWNKTIGAMRNILSPFADFVNLIGLLLVSFLAEASPGPTYWIRKKWTYTIDYLQGLFGHLVQSAASVGTRIRDTFTSIFPTTAISQEFTGIAGAATDSGNVIINGLGSAFRFIVGVLSAVIHAVDLVNKAFLNIGGNTTVDERIAARREIFSGFIKVLIGVGHAFVFVGKAIASFVQFEKQMIEGAIENLDLLGFTLLTLSSLPMTLLRQLEEGFERYIPQLGFLAAKGIPRAILFALPNLVALAISTGLIKAFERGFSDALDALPSRIKSFVDRLYGLLTPEVVGQINKVVSATVTELGQAMPEVFGKGFTFEFNLDDLRLGIHRFVDGPLVSFIDYLHKVGDTAKEVGANIKAVIEPLLRFKLGDIIPLLSFLPPLIPAFIGMRAAIDAIINLAASPALQGLYNFFSGSILPAALKTLTAIGAVVAYIGGALVLYPVAMLQVALRGVTSAVGALITQVQVLIPLLPEIARRLIETFGRAVAQVILNSATALAGLLRQVPYIGDVLATTLTRTVELVVYAFPVYVNLMVKALSPVWTAFKAVAGAYGKVLGDLFKGIAYFVDKGLKPLGPIIANVLDPRSAFKLLGLYLRTKGFKGIIKPGLLGLSPFDLLFSPITPRTIASYSAEELSKLPPAMLKALEAQSKRANLLKPFLGPIESIRRTLVDALKLGFRGAVDTAFPINIIKAKQAEYLKVLASGRSLKIAERYGLPLADLIDTPLANLAKGIMLISPWLQIIGRAANTTLFWYTILKPLDREMLTAIANTEVWGHKLTIIAVALGIARFAVVNLTDAIFGLAKYIPVALFGTLEFFDKLGITIGVVTHEIVGIGSILANVIKFSIINPLTLIPLGITAALNGVLIGLREMLKMIKAETQKYGDAIIAAMHGNFLPLGKALVEDLIVTPARLATIAFTNTIGRVFNLLLRGVRVTVEEIGRLIRHPIAETMRLIGLLGGVFSDVLEQVNVYIKLLQLDKLANFIRQNWMQLTPVVTTALRLLGVITNLQFGIGALVGVTAFLIHEYQTGFQTINSIIEGLQHPIDLLNSALQGMLGFLNLYISPEMTGVIANLTAEFVRLLPVITGGIFFVALLIKRNIGDAINMVVGGFLRVVGEIQRAIMAMVGFKDSIVDAATSARSQVFFGEQVHNIRRQSTFGGLKNPFAYSRDAEQQRKGVYLGEQRVTKSKAALSYQKEIEKAIEREVENIRKGYLKAARSGDENERRKVLGGQVARLNAQGEVEETHTIKPLVERQRNRFGIETNQLTDLGEDAARRMARNAIQGSTAEEYSKIRRNAAREAGLGSAFKGVDPNISTEDYDKVLQKLARGGEKEVRAMLNEFQEALENAHIQTQNVDTLYVKKIVSGSDPKTLKSQPYNYKAFDEQLTAFKDAKGLSSKQKSYLDTLTPLESIKNNLISAQRLNKNRSQQLKDSVGTALQPSNFPDNATPSSQDFQTFLANKTPEYKNALDKVRTDDIAYENKVKEILSELAIELNEVVSSTIKDFKDFEELNKKLLAADIPTSDAQISTGINVLYDGVRDVVNDAQHATQRAEATRKSIGELLFGFTGIPQVIETFKENRRIYKRSEQVARRAKRLGDQDKEELEALLSARRRGLAALMSNEGFTYSDDFKSNAPRGMKEFFKEKGIDTKQQQMLENFITKTRKLERSFAPADVTETFKALSGLAGKYRSEVVRAEDGLSEGMFRFREAISSAGFGGDAERSLLYKLLEKGRSGLTPQQDKQLEEAFTRIGTKIGSVERMQESLDKSGLINTALHIIKTGKLGGSIDAERLDLAKALGVTVGALKRIDKTPLNNPIDQLKANFEVFVENLTRQAKKFDRSIVHQLENLDKALNTQLLIPTPVGKLISQPILWLYTSTRDQFLKGIRAGAPILSSVAREAKDIFGFPELTKQFQSIRAQFRDATKSSLPDILARSTIPGKRRYGKATPELRAQFQSRMMESLQKTPDYTPAKASQVMEIFLKDAKGTSIEQQLKSAGLDPKAVAKSLEKALGATEEQVKKIIEDNNYSAKLAYPYQVYFLKGLPGLMAGAAKDIWKVTNKVLGLAGRVLGKPLRSVAMDVIGTFGVGLVTRLSEFSNKLGDRIQVGLENLSQQSRKLFGQNNVFEKVLKRFSGFLGSMGRRTGDYLSEQAKQLQSNPKTKTQMIIDAGMRLFRGIANTFDVARKALAKPRALFGNLFNSVKQFFSSLFSGKELKEVRAAREKSRADIARHRTQLKNAQNVPDFDPRSRQLKAQGIAEAQTGITSAVEQLKNLNKRYNELTRFSPGRIYTKTTKWLGLSFLKMRKGLEKTARTIEQQQVDVTTKVPLRRRGLKDGSAIGVRGQGPEPNALFPNANTLQNLDTQVDFLIKSIEQVQPLTNKAMAGMVRIGQKAAVGVGNYFFNSAQRAKDAWIAAQNALTGSKWPKWMQFAYKTGRSLVAALNHGAADRTAEAWQRTQQSTAQNMQQMTQTAQAAGQQISSHMQKSVGRVGTFFSQLTGSVGNVGKAGIAIGGAVTAVGFAAQTATYSLSTMGLVSEETSQNLNKFFEIFSLLGAIGGVATPVIAALASSMGALGSVAVFAATTVTGIGSAIAGVVGLGSVAFAPLVLGVGTIVAAVLGLYLAFKNNFLGIGNIAKQVGATLASVFSGPISLIERAWSGFVGNFGGKLMPIVQPAIDVGKGIVGALNHGSADLTAEAWDRTHERVSGVFGGLLAGAQSVAGSIGSALHLGGAAVGSGGKHAVEVTHQAPEQLPAGDKGILSGISRVYHKVENLVHLFQESVHFLEDITKLIRLMHAHHLITTATEVGHEIAISIKRALGQPVAAASGHGHGGHDLGATQAGAQAATTSGGKFNTVKRVGIAVGSAVGAVGVGTQIIGHSLESLHVLGEEQVKLIDHFGEVFTIISAIGNIGIPIFGAIGDGIKLIGTSVPGVGNGLTRLRGSIAQIGTTLTTLMGIESIAFAPLLLSIGAIAAGVAALYLAFKTNFLGIRTIATASVGAIQGAWSGFATWFGSLPLVGQATSMGEGIVGALNHGSADATAEAWDRTHERVGGVMKNLAQTASQTATGIASNLNIQGAQASLGSAKGTVVQAAAQAKDSTTGFIHQVLDGIKAEMAQLNNNLTHLVEQQNIGLEKLTSATEKNNSLFKYVFSSSGISAFVKAFTVGFGGFQIVRLILSIKEALVHLREPLERMGIRTGFTPAAVEPHNKFGRAKATISDLGQIGKKVRSVASFLPLIGVLSPQLAMVGGILTTISYITDEWAGTIEKVAGKAIKFLPLIGGIGIGLTALIALLEVATPGFNVLGAVIGTVAFTVKAFLGVFQGIWKALTEGGETKKTNPIVAYLKDVIATIGIMAQAGEEFGTTIGYALTKALLSPLSLIKSAWMGFVSWFATLPLVGSAVSIGEGIVGALNHGSADATASAWERTHDKILGWFGGIGQSASNLGSEISGKVTSAFSGVGNALKTGKEAVGNATTATKENLSEAKTRIDNLSSVLPEQVAQIAANVEQIPSILIDGFNQQSALLGQNNLAAEPVKDLLGELTVLMSLSIESIDRVFSSSQSMLASLQTIAALSKGIASSMSAATQSLLVRDQGSTIKPPLATGRSSIAGKAITRIGRDVTKEGLAQYEDQPPQIKGFHPIKNRKLARDYDQKMARLSQLGETLGQQETGTPEPKGFRPFGVITKLRKQFSGETEFQKTIQEEVQRREVELADKIIQGSQSNSLLLQRQYAGMVTKNAEGITTISQEGQAYIEKELAGSFKNRTGAFSDETLQKIAQKTGFKPKDQDRLRSVATAGQRTLADASSTLGEVKVSADEKWLPEAANSLSLLVKASNDFTTTFNTAFNMIVQKLDLIATLLQPALAQQYQEQMDAIREMLKVYGAKLTPEGQDYFSKKVVDAITNPKVPPKVKAPITETQAPKPPNSIPDSLSGGTPVNLEPATNTVRSNGVSQMLKEQVNKAWDFLLTPRKNAPKTPIKSGVSGVEELRAVSSTIGGTVEKTGKPVNYTPIQKRLSDSFSDKFEQPKGVQARLSERVGTPQPIQQGIDAELINPMGALIEAPETINNAWSKAFAFITQGLSGLVGFAANIGTALINLLNHSPTEKIPNAWDKMVERIKGFLQNDLLKFALGIAAAVTAAFALNKLTSGAGLEGVKGGKGLLKLSLYANAVNDIAGLTGVELPDFVQPLLMATTMAGVLADLSTEIIPGLLKSTSLIGPTLLKSLPFVGIVATAFGLLLFAWNKNIFNIQQKGEAAANFIKSAWNGAIGAIFGLFSGWLNLAAQAGKKLIDLLNHSPTVQIPKAWERAVNFIKGLLGSLLTTAARIGKGLINVLILPLKVGLGLISIIAGVILMPLMPVLSVIGLIGKGVLGVGQALLGIGALVVAAFVLPFVVAFKAVQILGTGILAAILAPIKTLQIVLTGVGKVFQFIWGLIVNTGSAIASILLVPFIAVKNIANSIFDLIRGIVDSIAGMGDDLLKGGQELVGALNPFHKQQPEPVAAPVAPPPPEKKSWLNSVNPFHKKQPEPVAAPVAPPPPEKKSWLSSVNPFRKQETEATSTVPTPSTGTVTPEIVVPVVPATTAETEIKAASVADNIAYSIQDRLDSLQREGIGLIGTMFLGDARDIGQSLGVLGSDVVDFFKRAAVSIVRLDLPGLTSAFGDFTSNLGYAASTILGAFGSMTQSAIAFALAGGAGLSPIILVLGGIAFVAAVVMTNFLGIRTILKGIIQIGLGVAQVLHGAFVGIIQVSQALFTILRGIYPALQGDFRLLDTGIDLLKASFELMTRRIGAGLGNIKKGFGTILEGIGQGLRQIIPGFDGLIFKFQGFLSLFKDGEQAGDMVATSLIRFINGIGATFRKTSENIQKFIARIPQLLTGVIERFKDFVQPKGTLSWKPLISRLRKELIPLEIELELMFPRLMKSLRSIGSGLLAPFKYIGSLLRGFFNRLAIDLPLPLRKEFIRARDALLRTWQQFTSFISRDRNIFEPMLGRLRRLNRQFTLIIGRWRRQWKNFKRELAQKDFLAGTFRRLLFFGKVWNRYINRMERAWQKFAGSNPNIPMFTSVFKGLRSMSRAFQVTVEFLQKRWEGLRNFLISTDFVSNLLRGVQRLSIGFGRFLDNLQLGIVPAVREAFSSISKWFENLVNTIKQGGKPFKAIFGNNLAEVSSNFEQFVTKSEKIWNQFIQLLGATANITVITDFLSKASDKFADFIPVVSRQWERFAQYIGRVDILASFFSTIKQLNASFGDTIVNMAHWWEKLAEKFKLPTFQDQFTFIFELNDRFASVINFIEARWQNLRQFLSETNLIPGLFVGVEWFSRFFSKTIGWLGNKWKALVEFLNKPNLFDNLFSQLRDFGKQIPAIGKWVKTTFVPIHKFIQGLMNDTEGTVNKSIEQIQKTFTTLKSFIHGIFVDIPGTIEKATDWIINKWKEFVPGIGNPLEKVLGIARKIAIALINTLNHSPTEKIPSAWEKAAQEIIGLFRDILNAARQVRDKIVAAFTWSVNKIKGSFQLLGNFIEGVYLGIAQNMSQSFLDMVPGVNRLLANIVRFGGVFKRILEPVIQLIANLSTKFRDVKSDTDVMSQGLNRAGTTGQRVGQILVVAFKLIAQVINFTTNILAIGIETLIKIGETFISIARWIKNATVSIKEFAIGFWTGFSKAIAPALEGIIPLVQKALLVLGRIGVVVPVVTGVLGSIYGVVIGTASAILAFTHGVTAATASVGYFLTNLTPLQVAITTIFSLFGGSVVLKNFKKIIDSIVSSIQRLFGKTKKTTETVQGVGDAIEKVGSSAQAIAKTANTVGRIGGSAWKAAEAVTETTKAFLTARDKGELFGKAVGGAIASLITLVKDTIALIVDIGDFITKPLSFLDKYFINFGNSVVYAITHPFETLEKITKGSFDAVQGSVSTLNQGISSTFTSIDFFAPIRTKIEEAKKAWSNFLQSFNEPFDPEPLLKGLRSAGEAIVFILKSPFAIASTAASVAFDFIVARFWEIGDAFRKLGESRIGKIFKYLFQAITVDAGSTLKSLYDFFFAPVTQFFENLANGARDKVNGAIQAIGDFLQTVGTNIKSGLSSFFSPITQFFEDLPNKAKDKITSTIQDISALLQNVGSSIQDALTAPLRAINAAWENTGNKITGIFKRLGRKSEQTGDDVQGNISEHSPGPTYQIRKHWQHTADFVQEKIGAIGKTAQTQGAQIEDALEPNIKNVAGTRVAPAMAPNYNKGFQLALTNASEQQKRHLMGMTKALQRHSLVEQKIRDKHQAGLLSDVAAEKLLMNVQQKRAATQEKIDKKIASIQAGVRKRNGELVNETRGVLTSVGSALSNFAPQLAAPIFAVGDVIDAVGDIASLPEKLGKIKDLIPKNLLGGLGTASAVAEAEIVAGANGVIANSELTVAGAAQTAAATQARSAGVSSVAAVQESAVVTGANTTTAKSFNLLSFSAGVAGKVIGFVFSPVMGIILGVAAAAFLLYQAWQNNFLGIQDVVSVIGDFFRLLGRGSWDIIAELFNTIGQSVNAIGVALGELGMAFISPFFPLMDLFGINTGGGWGGLLMAAMQGTVKAILLPLKVVASVIGGIVKIISSVIILIIKIGTVIVSGFMMPLKPVIAAFVFIGNVIKGIFEAIGSIGNAIGGTLGTIGGWLGFGTGGDSGIPQYQTGGYVPGSGPKPAILHGGEYVVSAQGVSANLPTLEAMNQGAKVSPPVSVQPPRPPQLPSARDIAVVAPATTATEVSGTAMLEALSQMKIELNFGDIILQAATGSEAANEFIDQISPQLRRTLRAMLKELLETSRN
jgi:phage-related protein